MGNIIWDEGEEPALHIWSSVSERKKMTATTTEMRMMEPGTSWNSWGEALKIWSYKVHDDDDDDDDDYDYDYDDYYYYYGGGGGGDIWDSGNSVSVTIVIASFFV
jgi:hypothetical protein